MCVLRVLLRHSLGLEAGCACLALEGGVPPVLDCVVCAARQQLCNGRPLVAIGLVGLDDDCVLPLRECTLLHSWVEVIPPPADAAACVALSGERQN